MIRKLGGIRRIAERYDVSLLSAALQFSAAPDVVSAIIPGAHQPEQIREIVSSLCEYTIPGEFWEELRMEGFIAEHARVPEEMTANCK